MTVNGRGPFRFVLDTGASALVLSPALAAQAGARPTNVAVGINGVPTGKLYRVDAVAVGGATGGATFHDVDAAAADLANMRAVLGDVDGVLGLSLFRDLLLTIDYPARQVVLARGRLPPPDGRDLVPLRWVHDSQLAVDVRVGGHSLPLVVDTGNDAALVVSRAAAADLPMARPPTTLPGRLATLHGFAPLEVGRLSGEATLGRHRLAGPPVTVAAGDPGGRDRALLGAAVLRHFAVTLDQRQMVGRFARDDDGPVDFPPLRNPPFRYARGADALVVTGPNPGASLDDVGLQPGDRITAVNGRPVAEFAAGDLNTPAASAEAWTCDVWRDGERLRITVPLTVVLP